MEKERKHHDSSHGDVDILGSCEKGLKPDDDRGRDEWEERLDVMYP